MESFPHARVNIDCKANSGIDVPVAAVRRLDCIDRICIGSFSDARLRRIRGALGDALCSSFGRIQTGLFG